MTARQELLAFWATQERKACPPLDPRGYLPPFEGPEIGFSGVAKTPTPRGGEDDFTAALGEQERLIDCGEPLSYYDGLKDGIAHGRAWQGFQDFRLGFLAACVVWFLAACVVANWFAG